MNINKLLILKSVVNYKCLLVFIIGLFSHNAAAINVNAPIDWWSSRTSSSNVVEFVGNRLRLEGGFNSGFIEGTIALPSGGDWKLNFNVVTDESLLAPTEFVELVINGTSVGTVFNTPADASTPFNIEFTGDTLTYRFDFSSPSTQFATHLVVFNGNANANVVDQAPDGVIDTPTNNIEITAGQTVNFTATGTDVDNNLPLEYLWTFGAGSGVANSTDEDPGNVTFNQSGVFTVVFLVTDNLGLVDPTVPTVTVTVNAPVLVSPTPNSIPTLSEWSVMILAAILFIVGFRGIRRA